MKRVASSVVLLAILASSGMAFGKDPTPDEVERARTFFNAGAQAYTAQRYALAARSFDQAYELAPRPQLLFSLAQAERKEFLASNDPTFLRRAIQHYKAYLEQAPAGGRQTEAREAKASLEARLARLDPAVTAAAPQPEVRKASVTVFSPTPGAQVSLDSGPALGFPYESELTPGKHRVRVFAEGYFDREVEVSGDKPVAQPVSLPLQERPSLVTVVLDTQADIFVDGRIVATAPVSRPIEIAPGPHVIAVVANGKKPLTFEVVLPRGKPFRLEPKLETSGQRIVALSLLGVGAAGIVTGCVFGVLSLGQESRVNDIEDERAAGNITDGQLVSHNRSIDRRDTYRNTSIVTLSAGAAVAVGGALLYLFDWPNVSILPPRSVEPTPGQQQPIDLSASPMLGPGLWGGSMTATF